MRWRSIVWGAALVLAIAGSAVAPAFAQTPVPSTTVAESPNDQAKPEKPKAETTPVDSSAQPPAGTAEPKPEDAKATEPKPAPDKAKPEKPKATAPESTPDKPQATAPKPAPNNAKPEKPQATAPKPAPNNAKPEKPKATAPKPAPNNAKPEKPKATAPQPKPDKPTATAPEPKPDKPKPTPAPKPTPVNAKPLADDPPSSPDEATSSPASAPATATPATDAPVISPPRRPDHVVGVSPAGHVGHAGPAERSRTPDEAGASAAPSASPLGADGDPVAPTTATGQVVGQASAHAARVQPIDAAPAAAPGTRRATPTLPLDPGPSRSDLTLLLTIVFTAGIAFLIGRETRRRAGAGARR